MEKHLHLIHFWKNNIDNIESSILKNIWAELKLQVDQQVPTKPIRHCKAKLRTLTHLLSMHPFPTPRKHQKTLRFSDVFRG